MAEKKPRLENSEKLKKLQDELRSLIAQAEQLRSQIDAINAVIDDLFAASEILDYVAKEGAGKTVLVPIGAGNFIKAKIEDTKSVVMAIGGRLSVEASIEDAKKAIETRVATLERIRLDLLRKLEEVNRRINEILPKVEELAREVQA
ncbi:MAG: prefoldin subunit alpha [Crenarchaeota archaeon]|nr:prefoldin subunit alpha [Thermoproteota archaeon]